MKLYPATNTVVTGNDLQPDALNENTQVLFETANGGLDRHNFPSGTASNGLEAKDFQGKSFHKFTTGQGSGFTTLGGGWVPYKFDSNTHNSEEQGMASGFLQIRFTLASIGFDNESLVGYVNSVGLKNNLPRTAFSIYVDGLKVGETDAVFKANNGTITLPFFFYNPGGSFTVDLYCAAHSGTILNGETVRITIDKYFYHFTTRIR